MLYSRSNLLESSTPHELRGLVRDGVLVRLARGMYVDGLDLSGWPEQIHAVKALAHGRRCAHVVSHVSAAVIHGLPVPGADLSEVHFSRPGHGGNDLVGDRRLHAGDLEERWVTSIDGVRVTNVPRTVIDVARTQPHLAAVAAIDAALHRGVTDPAELVEAFEAEHRWVGSPWARKALRAADGRPESPGETWSRLAVADLHPGHELQFSVYDESGKFVARPDGGWPFLGLAWEYDGEGKYEELRRRGETREDVMARQIQRQGKLERLNWIVVRGGGEDLPHRDAFRERVATAVRAAESASRPRLRGTCELMPALTVDVREPVQWAAAMREEMYGLWRSRHQR